ncbi:MAG: Ig-like domain-containing protein [Gemmatimonadota bacterium]
MNKPDGSLEPAMPPQAGPAFVGILPDDVAVPAHDTVRARVVSTSVAHPTRIQWSVSDTALATVDSTGLVFTRALGVVTVRAVVSSAADRAIGAATLRIE